MRRWILGALTSVLVAGSGAVAVPVVSAAVPTAIVNPTAVDQAKKAARLLDGIPIKGRAPKTGYSRTLFGPAWTDSVKTVEAGGNGCSTRNDILRRDLTSKSVSKNGCVVTAGVLKDPYSGVKIRFKRGPGTSSKVQIDHVVALSDAWQKGAQGWSAPKRWAFANDPINLQAVDGPTNMRKGDGDAATWLPPSKAYRCTYVARQVLVKAKYGVWVTQAEHDAILRILGSCSAPVPKLAKVPKPVVKKTTSSTPTRATGSSTGSSTPPRSCYPRSSAGNCYKPGQFCAAAHRGMTGVDAYGATIRCAPSGSAWRWTR